MGLDFSVLHGYGGVLALGAWWTAVLTVSAAALSLLAGVLFALTLEGQVAAMTELYTDGVDPTKLHTGLTGARREHRRRGLALALKLAALGVARERGTASVWTGNATTNAPMLALNTRLGFRPRTAWIEMQRGRVEDA